MMDPKPDIFLHISMTPGHTPGHPQDGTSVCIVYAPNYALKSGKKVYIIKKKILVYNRFSNDGL